MTEIDKLVAELRTGLAGVSPGPWFRSGVRFRMGGGEWHSIARYDDLKKTDVGVAIVGFDPRTGEGMADANWIARCSPDNIASILDDRDLLAAVVAEARRADVLIAALEFYANPAVYAPHPHGPAFDRRDISFKAKNALAEFRGVE